MVKKDFFRSIKTIPVCFLSSALLKFMYVNQDKYVSVEY